MPMGWMPDCEKMSELVSASRDCRLPFVTRILMKIHLFMCGPCQEHAHQIDVICRASEHLDEFCETQAEAPTLSDETKAAIKNALCHPPSA